MVHGFTNPASWDWVTHLFNGELYPSRVQSQSIISHVMAQRRVCSLIKSSRLLLKLLSLVSYDTEQ